MSYEYPFDDDREVTVGDLRVLFQEIRLLGCYSIALVLLTFCLVAVAADYVLLSLVAWIGSLLVTILAFAIWRDGFSRRLVEVFKELDTEPLTDRRIGERQTSARGDD